jgi:hypothetical protein
LPAYRLVVHSRKEKTMFSSTGAAPKPSRGSPKTASPRGRIPSSHQRSAPQPTPTQAQASRAATKRTTSHFTAAQKNEDRQPNRGLTWPDVVDKILTDGSALAKALIVMIILAIVLSAIFAIVLWALTSTGLSQILISAADPQRMAGTSGLLTLHWTRKGRGFRQ